MLSMAEHQMTSSGCPLLCGPCLEHAISCPVFSQMPHMQMHAPSGRTCDVTGGDRDPLQG